MAVENDERQAELQHVLKKRVQEHAELEEVIRVI